MKTIAFRAWDKKHKIMLPGTNIWNLCEDGEYGLVWYLGNRDYAPESFGDSEFLELMQFIGLTDKNGKAIYEGDIFEIEFDEKKILTKIIFKDCKFQLALTNDKEWEDNDKEWEDWEEERSNLENWITDLNVVGNIYENPELIK